MRLLLRFFFRRLGKTSQAPFDTARVNTYAESLAHDFDEIDQAQCGILGTCLHQVREYIVGELVGTVWTARAGEETWHAAFGERFARLIKRRAREAKSRRRTRDRRGIDSDLPQHLVLDLDKIVGGEEDTALEERIGNVLRVGVQGAIPAEEFPFSGSWALCQCDLPFDPV